MLNDRSKRMEIFKLEFDSSFLQEAMRGLDTCRVLTVFDCIVDSLRYFIRWPLLDR